MKILLIAGHGQGDPGAVGNGFSEADLTRETVTAISKNLENYAEVDVFDFGKNMYQYLKDGNTYPFNNYDYVLEVHFNAFNGSAYGTEVLVHQNEASVSVEEKILENMALLGFVKRGVKKRSDLLVMNTVKKIYGVSHALLEVCFIDNKGDMERYQANKEGVFKAIAEGIKSGFGLVPSEENPPQDRAPLVSANDIVWELSQWIEITDVAGAVEALDKAKNEESPLYWMLYKIVNR
ncbi:MAG: N-acetylmuramoyl-L-alanine amidase [Clostridia bacterium]|nr:N-acetylmuramoyl-L-alanine amidase [Clostridia bacterium]